MSKKDTGLNYEEILGKTRILKVGVESEMKKSFISYAMAVNVSRAIPDVRDGLKPVHRRILYAMGNELGLYSDKPTRKCARIVGEVMGKFHPHGDSAIYDAIVRMAQPFSMRYMLVEGQGNFGSVDGDPAAAQRYTEAKLSKIANEMLRDMDKDTVDMYPNFDETTLQPRVLPSRFPNLLVNGSSGIAVGMATNIPPHNMNEVIAGVIAQMKNPDIELDELMRYVPAPDFPTGGIIMGRSGIRQAYKTGQGSFILRAKTEIEEFNNGNRQRIVVTELPYQVNKAKLIEQIAGLVKDKRIEGISDINDESDRTGMRMVIDVKKDASAQVVLNMLFKHTNLQISFGMIMLALLNNEPKILSLKEINDAYIKHQREIIVRRTKFDLNKALEREHILQGLLIALANIDEVIKVIKESDDRNDALTNLMNAFGLSEKQANAILDMRLSRITHLEIETIRNELTEIDKLIAHLREVLATPSMIDEIIVDELNGILEKYGDDRRTELSNDYGEIDLADIVAEEDIVVSMTHLGYVKRLATSEYRAQRRGGVGITAHKPKEEDVVEQMFVCSTHDDLLCFSNFGRVYQMKGYEIPEAQRTARGRAIVNILPITTEEKINAIIPIKNYEDGFLMMITKNGLIKKTPIAEFVSIRKNGKIATVLEDGDELMTVLFTNGNDELLLATKLGKCIRFSENDVRSMGRVTKGVHAMGLKEGDRIIGMVIVDETRKVLTVTENGFGKRTPLSDYRLQLRAGKGVKASIINEKTGNVVGVKLISDDEDVMLISDDGTMLRVGGDEISVMGRDTVGVKIMRLKEGKVCSIAIVEKEIEESEESGDESKPLPSVETSENAETLTVTAEGLDFEEVTTVDESEDNL